MGISACKQDDLILVHMHAYLSSPVSSFSFKEMIRFLLFIHCFPLLREIFL